MEKKENLYFKFVYQYKSKKGEKSLGIILSLLSYPRTLLEVFIRKNMGERYFSIGQTIFIFLVLAFLPYYLAPMFNAASYLKDTYNIGLWSYKGNEWGLILSSSTRDQFFENLDIKLPYTIARFTSWYIFLVLFLIASRKRQLEINHLPSVLDGGRSTVYSGDIHPLFINFRWQGNAFDIRRIETFLEPLFFFISGLVLVIFGQVIGYVLIISSFAYRFNAHINYKLGDEFIMDLMDTQLFNEEKYEVFVERNEINNSRGVRYYGRKPADKETRRQLAEYFSEEEIAVAN